MRLLAKLELRFLSQDVNVLCETSGEWPLKDDLFLGINGQPENGLSLY